MIACLIQRSALKAGITTEQDGMSRELLIIETWRSCPCSYRGNATSADIEAALTRELNRGHPRPARPAQRRQPPW